MNQLKSAFEVFDKKQKRSLVYLTFIIFIDSFVELLGVTVILPFINAVIAPEQLLQNKFAAWAYDTLGMKNTNEFIIVIAAMIIAVYILKNIFLVYMYNLQYKFSYYGKKQMQNTLMRYYIGQDYTFFLNLNSAELMRNINTDPEMFYTAVLNALTDGIGTLCQRDHRYLFNGNGCDDHAGCGSQPCDHDADPLQRTQKNTGRLWK